VNESVFKGTLGVLILEAKELQDHGVLYFFLGSQLVFWNGTLGSFDQCGFVPGERCARIDKAILEFMRMISLNGLPWLQACRMWKSRAIAKAMPYRQ